MRPLFPKYLDCEKCHSPDGEVMGLINENGEFDTHYLCEECYENLKTVINKLWQENQQASQSEDQKNQ